MDRICRNGTFQSRKVDGNLSDCDRGMLFGLKIAET